MAADAWPRLRNSASLSALIVIAGDVPAPSAHPTDEKRKSHVWQSSIVPIKPALCSATIAASKIGLMNVTTTSGEPAGINRNCAAFLVARGLDLELCEKMGVTGALGRDGNDWVCFAYEVNGQRQNRKFRRIDQKLFMQDKGGSQVLWRFDCISDEALIDEPLIITEGELDALSAIQAGFLRVVSVPGGAPNEALGDAAMESAKYASVTHAMAKLESVKRIIIAADNDANGTNLLNDLKRILGPARCQFLPYPKGCKDLNDVLMKQGESGVQAVIANAKWVKVAGVHKLYDLPPLPPSQVYRGNVHAPIDDLLPLIAGQISLFTGIPGHGKSSLINALAWSIAKRDGVHICHGTFEAVPQREYVDDCIGFMTGAPPSQVTESEREDVRDFINEHITFLVADGYAEPGSEEYFDPNLDWFLEGARTAVVRDKCRIVILDPWSQIEHEYGGTVSETTYIQRSIRRFRQFARTFECHVAIVAHPTKMRKLEDGDYAMPEGYEVSGSAHWYNGVDMGVTSHRAPPLIKQDEEWIPDPKSTRVLIRAWKKKIHRTMGKPGDVYASFNSSTNRYTAAEHWEDRTHPKRYSDLPGQNDD